MAAYVVAIVHEAQPTAELLKYLKQVDQTLQEFGGRFLVHGGNCLAREGEWTGELVILEFPDPASARNWYDSPAYQAILPLRQKNARTTLVLAEGVPPHYRALGILQRNREQG